MNQPTDRPTRSLLDIRRSQYGTIVTLPQDSEVRSQCIRLGLGVGAQFRCIERLPGGTLVIEIGRQELALGNALAKTIGITTTDAAVESL